MALRRGCVVLMLVFSVACRTDKTAGVDPTPTAVVSPCAAPHLEPTDLPDGVEPVDREPYFGQPERTRTWADEEVVVQIGEGFSGDHGDDPEVRQLTVRGNPDGRLAPMNAPDGTPVVVVDWDEETRCGPVQYSVVTEGLGEEETLRIAQSLDEETA